MARKLKLPAENETEHAARILSDIFPRMMVHLSRLGGSLNTSVLSLTGPQIKALAALDIAKRPMRMSALAQALGVTQSTVTDVTKRLARKEYIRKKRLAGDERVICVSLSPRGRKAVSELRAEKYHQFLKICQALSSGTRKQLVESHQLILKIYSEM